MAPPLPRYSSNRLQSRGFCMCIKPFNRDYAHYLEAIEVVFKHGDLFEYTTTSGWFYELAVGSYKMLFEDSDFDDCFARLTKAEYREYKIDSIMCPNE